MAIDWDELKKAMSPIPNYEDLARRWQEALKYEFVQRSYDFSMAEIEAYTARLLGGDTHGRYTKYCAWLSGTFRALGEKGVGGIFELFDRVMIRAAFEGFVQQSGLEAEAVMGALKYLVYWVIPDQKPVRELVKREECLIEAATTLRLMGVRWNLDLLERGTNARGRKALAAESGLDAGVVADLVNRADFSRLPWTSSATIANLIGSGYASLARVAEADFEQINADFYRYGAAIGKNLKIGNEIDNVWRIARILPRVVEEG